MAIANYPDETQPSHISQKVRTIFALNKTTGIVFAVLAFFAASFFVSWGSATGVGIVIFGIVLLFILFPFSLFAGVIVLDTVSLGIIVPLIFLYLYFLSCLISYGVLWVGSKVRRT